MNSSSLNDIAYSLLNEVRGGHSSNTEDISIDQIKYAIKYYRTTFIRRDAWRNNNRLRSFQQDLGDVPLDIVETSEEESIMRTKRHLPNPIRLKEFDGVIVTHLGITGDSIPLIDAHRSRWEKFNKYNSSSAYATLEGGYVYIFNDSEIDAVSIKGVFEDPEQVHRFTQDNGLSLYDDNSPFPISTDMLEGIKKAILGAELRSLVSTPNDNETNNQQDPKMGRE